MTPLRRWFGLALVLLAFVLLALGSDLERVHGQSSDASRSRKIVLVAGETAKVDKVGHHDYIAGCKCLESMLRQTVTNGVLWSAGVDIPTNGAHCKSTEPELTAMQTPRQPPKPAKNK